MTLVLLLIIAFLAGCATALTPVQERAYAAFEDCRKEGQTTILKYVTPEGAFQIEGRDDEVYKVKRCLEERYGYRFGN